MLQVAVMLRLLLTLALASSGCLLAEVRPAPKVSEPAPSPVSLATFELRLEGLGAWLQLPELGRVWQPAKAYAGSDFAPYGSDGRWLLTDAGWVFDSPDAFAWATYHYGRWSLVPSYGWVWSPDTTWAPAWVAWRVGRERLGWAPLAPDGAPPLTPGRWYFIEPRHFRSMNPSRGGVRAEQFEQAAAATEPGLGEVATFGPSAELVSAASGRPVIPVALSLVGSALHPAPPTGAWRKVTTAEVRITAAPATPLPSAASLQLARQRATLERLAVPTSAILAKGEPLTPMAAPGGPTVADALEAEAGAGFVPEATSPSPRSPDRLRVHVPTLGARR
jgi:hypothetical protein